MPHSNCTSYKRFFLLQELEDGVIQELRKIQIQPETKVCIAVGE